jgi:hypothetical protein
MIHVYLSYAESKYNASNLSNNKTFLLKKKEREREGYFRQKWTIGRAHRAVMRNTSRYIPNIQVDTGYATSPT